MAQKKKAPDPHPEDELRSLRTSLEKSGPVCGYAFRGEERYFREQGAKLVASAAESRGAELCRHDAKDPEFSLSTLLDDLTGGALFATERCVVVQHANVLLTKSSKGYSQAFTDAAKARLASEVSGTIVLAAESLRADNPLLKAILAAGGVSVVCRKLWETPPPWDPDPRKAELVQWLYAKARARNVRLEMDEAAFVVAATGNDLYALDAQLENLRERGDKGVRELVSWESGGSPWVVAGYLASGDAARSVAGVEALFQSGFHGKDGSRTVDRAGLVAMLVNAVSGKAREASRAATALESGETMDRAAELAGVTSRFARPEFDARVRSRSAGDWKRFTADVAGIERKTRIGAGVDANDFALLALRWARTRKARQ